MTRIHRTGASPGPARAAFRATLVGLLLAVLAPAAHAATANARFCVRNNLLYVDDAVTAFVNADYLLNGSTTNPARGFRVRVQRLGTPPLPNPDFDGSTEDGPGSLWCTPVLSLVVGAQYAATVYSEGDIASESFTVNKTVLAPAVAQHVAFVNIPAVPPAYYTVTTPATEDWHIAAVMSWSLYHNDTYTSGESYVAFSDNNCGDVDGDGLDDPCCDDHTSWTSCNSGGLIYYKHAHTEQRYTIAHELGHRVASLANGGVGANTDDTRASGSVCPGAAAHRRDHWEWSSIAANEGFAHYWADVTMNDVAGADCVSWSKDNVNWNLTGDDDGHVYDCDGPPVSGLGLADSDWVGDVCAADLPVTNTSNEYDYQRFFWDMTTDGGMDTYDVLAVWDAADPHLWTADGAGSGAGYPCYEFEDAAAAYSGGAFWADWVDQSIVNGVYR